MPYDYYSLPFCSSKPVAELEHRWDYLGEVLEGNDLISSGLAIQFRAPVRDPRARGARPSATTRANYKRADSLALLTHVRGRATPNRSAVAALRVLKVPKIGGATLSE